jgi:hypothetical protein
MGRHSRSRIGDPDHGPTPFLGDRDRENVETEGDPFPDRGLIVHDSLAAFFSILIAQLSTLSFKSTPRHPPSLILKCRMINGGSDPETTAESHSKD